MIEEDLAVSFFPPHVFPCILMCTHVCTYIHACVCTYIHTYMKGGGKIRVWGRGRERNYITHNIFPKCAFDCNDFSNSGSSLKARSRVKG